MISNNVSKYAQKELVTAIEFDEKMARICPLLIQMTFISKGKRFTIQ